MRCPQPAEVQQLRALRHATCPRLAVTGVLACGAALLLAPPQRSSCCPAKPCQPASCPFPSHPAGVLAGGAALFAPGGGPLHICQHARAGGAQRAQRVGATRGEGTRTERVRYGLRGLAGCQALRAPAPPEVRAGLVGAWPVGWQVPAELWTSWRRRVQAISSHSNG